MVGGQLKVQMYNGNDAMLKGRCDRSENRFPFAISTLHQDLRPSPERGGPNPN